MYLDEPQHNHPNEKNHKPFKERARDHIPIALKLYFKIILEKKDKL
jgi:hypothetical protein